MTVRKNKSKKRIKSLGILFLTIILPAIISTPLFSIFNEPNQTIEQDNTEKDESREPQFPTPSSNLPNAHYFSYYKTITIDHTKVNGDHSNFPVLISIIDSDLDDKAQFDGDDIAFANSTAWLDHEIELYDPSYSFDEAQLIAWVQIPFLYNSTDTFIFMFYGNSTIGPQEHATGVWDSYYKGVWHLKEDPGGPNDIKDSTSNDKHGTSNSMWMSNQVSGKIDGSLNFDGNYDYISVGDVGPEIKTIEFWMNPDSLASYGDVDNSGPHSPTATGETYDQWNAPTNAYASDDLFANASGYYPDQDYYNFSFNIPADALIQGIEVSIEGMSGTQYQTARCRIRLSGNGGSTYTDYYELSWWSSYYDDYDTAGGSTNTWGKLGGWSPSEFNNANFRVRLEESGQAILLVDHLIVTVYYRIPGDIAVIDLNGNAQISIDKDGGEIKAFGFPGTTNIYINGTMETKVGIGTWYHVVIINTIGVLGSDFVIAGNISVNFDGLFDEVRLSNITRSPEWIATEYNNQYDPDNFYFISEERTSVTDVRVNAFDLYGHIIPNVNISLIQNNIIIRSAIANASGAVMFEGVLSIDYKYNFSVSMTSNIAPYHTIIINRTSEAILIEGESQTINLICNISRNIFNVVDTDGIPLDSGWIIVGNYSDPIQNCTIDQNGQATFRWLNNSAYNYTVWYRDVDYNHENQHKIEVATGDIFKSQYDSEINITTILTTVNFTLFTKNNPQPVDGAKLILGNANLDRSIVNLTTDIDGKATLRWVNSSGINSDYSLQVSFYGKLWDIEIEDLMTGVKKQINFTVKAKAAYNVSIILEPTELEKFETDLISLNPISNIQVEWGSNVTFRALFNVTKVPSGYENLTGPTYAEPMSYKIFEDSTLILSGIIPTEDDYIGRHKKEIRTDELETGIVYIIIITAQKPGYVLPSEDIIMSLYLLENELILNQSENDDSPQSIPWQEFTNMSVKPYGIISEDFSIDYNMYNCNNGTFQFSIPSISNEWVLSRIVFNVYDVTFGVGPGEINLNITDDFGVRHDFDSNWDHYYYDPLATNGSWSNLEVILNKGEVTGGDTFNFTFDGTFVGDIDIIATSYFIRDKINVQYSKFNVTDSIPILTDLEGWAIQNITFLIYDCYNFSAGSKANLASLSNLNITTNEGYTYSLDSGDIFGNGNLTIDDRIIYPLDNQFLFTIEANGNLTFHVIIKVEYIQEFLQNQYIEKINISKTEHDFGKTDTFQVKFIEKKWTEDYATLVFSGISPLGGLSLLPSEINMTITIEGETYNIEDLMVGQGIFSLEGLEKDKILTAIIDTNLTSSIIFNLSFMIKYSRIVTYETKGQVNFSIIEKPEIFGGVQYNEDLGYYLLFINTSLLDANDYTIRFTITKENYKLSTKDLELFVLERFTLLNGSADFFRTFEQMYVMEPVNFTFYYIDALTYQPITDLDQKTYVWEYYDDEGNVIKTGQGTLFTQGYYHILDIDTEKFKLGEYLIVITLSKDNYEYKTGIITLTVLERPTLINGESVLSVIQENIYIGDAINFTFTYIDEITNMNIKNLAVQSFIWEEFNATGALINNGTGSLVSSLNDLYVLDFDTKTRDPNTFKLVITLDKENYTFQSATILLNINLREFSYTLGDNFRNNKINIGKGKNVVIEIHLIDLTRNNFDLLDAIVQISIKGHVYTFQQVENGIYRYELSTNNIDTFFASKILTGVIMISKENYVSEEFSITIVVEMEEIFSGIPIFYFLLGLITSISLAGSIVGYRVYKNVTTPTFVKRVRAMKKAIEGEKEISESLLYPSKIEFIGRRVKSKWDKLGLSLADILRIKIEKETLKRKISEDVTRREFTPLGLLLMQWDEKMGTKVLAKYPENLDASEKTLMQIYGTHEYSGEKGIITLTVGMTNIISYYTGPEQAFYLLLFLNLDDDPDVYEGGMANIISIILENLKDDSYLQMIPYLFQRLSIYPSLSDEEILALNYQDEIKRLIINMLRDDGAIIKSELSIWLREKALEGFIDLDAILLELAKKDIIKQIAIKGIPSALIVLTTDIFMLRVPPVKLLEDPVNRGLPSQFAKTYPSEVKKFFQEYHPTEEDNLKIIELFINPQVYETLRLLRTAIVTRQDLEKLSKKGVEDIYGVLKILWDNHMIKVYQDENDIEYYALLSDFYMDLLFPKYMLETIKTSYEQKSKTNKVLIEYLKALEDTYFELKKQEK
ncbi:MAG: hypothetical protein ACFFB0_06565 [Promethearchaeota archaeon]